MPPNTDRHDDSTLSRLDQAIHEGRLDAEIVAPGVPTPTVPDAAEALGVSPDRIIKSLLFADSDGSVVLAVAPGPSRVSRERLANVSGLQKLKLASPEVVLARTGYPAGGTPPVCHQERLRVFVDSQVAAMDSVYGGGGKLDLLLRIRPSEIVRVTGAEVADIVD